MANKKRVFPKNKAVYVGKNLTNEAAYKKAVKKATADWRGFKYNKKSGYAKLI